MLCDISVFSYLMWLDDIEYRGKSRTNERQSRTLSLNIAIDVDGSWMKGTQKCIVKEKFKYFTPSAPNYKQI